MICLLKLAIFGQRVGSKMIQGISINYHSIYSIFLFKELQETLLSQLEGGKVDTYLLTQGVLEAFRV